MCNDFWNVDHNHLKSMGDNFDTPFFKNVFFLSNERGNSKKEKNKKSAEKNERKISMSSKLIITPLPISD